MQNKTNPYIYLGAAAFFVAVVAVIIVYVMPLLLPNQPDLSQNQVVTDEREGLKPNNENVVPLEGMTPAHEAWRGGDYEDALELLERENQDIYNEANEVIEKVTGTNPNATVSDLSEDEYITNFHATRMKQSESWLNYLANRDLQSKFDYIDFQKSVAENPINSPILRARSMYDVGTSFCAFNRDPDVLGYLYSGEYSKYLEEANGDAALASFKLSQESYDIYPTPRATINIAHWYVKELLFKDLTEATRNVYITQAEQWLEEAERQADNESRRTAGLTEANQFENTYRYINYLYWRAFTIGGLAQVVGGEYAEQYKQVYDELIVTAEATQSDQEMQYIPFAHVSYAHFVMAIENNEAEALERLDMAVATAKSFGPESSLAEFIYFTLNSEVVDIVSQSIYDSIEVSPTFKAFAEELTG